MIPDASTVVITGATSGIGLETARRLTGRARLLIVQGPEPADRARAALRALDGGPATVRYVPCDFERLADVAEAARTMLELAAGPIDAVINNAGVPGAPTRRVTRDAHERTLQVNFLAMVLLTEHLLPALADGARIVNVASATHQMAHLDLDDIELERRYDPVGAYARSKLAIILYTRWLAERLDSRPVTPVCLNPGVIATTLLHAMFGIQGADVGRGAASLLAALTDDARGGEYFDEGRLVTPSAQARDAGLGRALMAYALDALGPNLPRAVRPSRTAPG